MDRGQAGDWESLEHWFEQQPEALNSELDRISRWLGPQGPDRAVGRAWDPILDTEPADGGWSAGEWWGAFGDGAASSGWAADHEAWQSAQREPMGSREGREPDPERPGFDRSGRWITSRDFWERIHAAQDDQRERNRRARRPWNRYVWFPIRRTYRRIRGWRA